ncbi:MAG: PAS domain S-box protein [Azoarcus sp. PHD]|nr:MAG: PAS domain S-box protein [Azoarcus sp. PHD]
MASQRPLRHLLLFILLFFGLLVALAQFSFIVQTHSDEARSQLEALVRHTGVTLAANLEAAMREGDDGFVDHLLAQQITLPNLTYAALVGGTGRVLSGSHPGMRDQDLARFGFKAAPDGLVETARSTLGAQILDDRDAQQMWGVFPVRLPSPAGGIRARQTAYVSLLIDTAPHLRAALYHAAGQSVIVLLPILLLSGAIWVMVSVLLTNRIERLLVYARSQARGGTLPEPVSGADELGQLDTALADLMREVLDSRDFHVRLLECMPNPTWRAGADGRRNYVNRAWQAFTGREVAQELGEGWFQGVHPDDVAGCRQVYSDAMARREAFVTEYRLRFHDGGYHWLSDHGEPLFGTDGVFLGFIGSCYDLQQEKTASAAVAASEERFRSLVEHALVGVFLIHDGRMLYGNPQLVEWFGYTTESIVGVPVSALVQTADLPLVEGQLRLREAGNTDRAHYVLRAKRHDGSEFLAEVYGIGIPHEEGTVVIGTLLDVTERKTAEARIRQLNADLELRVEQRTNELAALNDELETFAYSVAHDLKAPLRGIDGYSHLLLEDHVDRLDEEGRLFIGNIRAGVKQMARLIDDLLAYSRMERRSLQRTSVNLATVLRGILAEHAAEIDENQVHIDVDVSDISVEVDPDGLAQVLRNLVGNALKYSRQARPAKIRIVARAEGDWCHLFVRDNGIGFDMKFHDRIFDIFQRLQRAEDYSGTGVGLAIVRKAMQRMGGRVWAESAPGEGASFHLELPR